MKKTCTYCGLECDAEKDFFWKSKARGLRQSRCKSCMSFLTSQHYERNKQAYAVRVRARDELITLENRKRLDAYLAAHPCVDCGRTDIRCLEFDHVRGEKLSEVAKMANTGYSWSTIELEIEKCDVRCVNCHRIITCERENTWRYSIFSSTSSPFPNTILGSKAQMVTNKRQLHTYLIEHPCVDCGCKDIRVLEFDHVRSTKYRNVGRLVIEGALWSVIEAEIAKCEVRCGNCHRIVSVERWWASQQLKNS